MGIMRCTYILPAEDLLDENFKSTVGEPWKHLLHDFVSQCPLVLQLPASERGALDPSICNLLDRMGANLISLAIAPDIMARITIRPSLVAQLMTF
jgi:hypothetical protein